MIVDENTRGSIANQEAVRLLTSWMSTFFIADCFVCSVGGLEVAQAHDCLPRRSADTASL
jgi:hypothetical protein